MTDKLVLGSTGESISFEDQGFFNGLSPVNDDCRFGTHEDAEYFTILFGQLMKDTTFYTE